MRMSKLAIYEVYFLHALLFCLFKIVSFCLYEPISCVAPSGIFAKKLIRSVCLFVYFAIIQSTFRLFKGQQYPVAVNIKSLSDEAPSSGY